MSSATGSFRIVTVMSAATRSLSLEPVKSQPLQLAFKVPAEIGSRGKTGPTRNVLVMSPEKSALQITK